MAPIPCAQAKHSRPCVVREVVLVPIPQPRIPGRLLQVDRDRSGGEYLSRRGIEQSHRVNPDCPLYERRDLRAHGVVPVDKQNVAGQLVELLHVIPLLIGDLGLMLHLSR